MSSISPTSPAVPACTSALSHAPAEGVLIVLRQALSLTDAMHLALQKPLGSRIVMAFFDIRIFRVLSTILVFCSGMNQKIYELFVITPE